MCFENLAAVFNSVAPKKRTSPPALAIYGAGCDVPAGPESGAAGSI
jgi:hypothetical protein